MPFLSLNCPQCGAPLPRQARWRMVACPHCGATVTKSDEVVEAAWFHDAYVRNCAARDTGGRLVRVQGERYRLLAQLGAGASAEVFLAERVAALPERITLKLARASAGDGVLEREAGILDQLQAIASPTSAYFSQRLPQTIACGLAEDASGQRREALLLRHPAGFWGSLAAVRRNYPAGIDARHAVWLWRRLLEVLAYLHDAGWTHGDLHPEHLLVHPRDHGVLAIGWSAARAGSDAAAMARDLRQSAWSMRMLLAGSGHADAREPALPATVPAPLATLLRAASEAADGTAPLDAAGLEQALAQAARESFGAPKFIAFQPQPQAG